MKRFLALIMTVCILFSLAAVNATAVDQQNATDDVVYVEDSALEAENITAPEAGEQAPATNSSTHTDHAKCACAISGASCADHSSAAQAATWTEWTETDALPTGAGNFYLSANVVLKKQQVFSATTVICLNGFSITRDSSATDFGALIRVWKGDLVLMNCKAEISGGKLVSNANTAKISGGNTAKTEPGAIYVDPNRSLAVYGVEISNNQCTNNNVNGWTAGGIFAKAETGDTTSVKLNYCRLTGNKATQSGGGAMIIRGGTTDVRNTVFSGNEGNGASSVGGAVWMLNGSPTVNFTNCEFTGNKLTDSNAQGGAALYVKNGIATLTNVTMTGNTNAGHHGTAITVDSGTVNLDDSTITSNTNSNSSSAKKGGMAAVNNNAKISVSGKTVIDNNIVGTNGGSATGVECNLYLRTSGAKLTVGALEEGASVRVTTGDHTVSDDPSVFLTYNDKTSEINAKSNEWLIYENRENAANKNCIVGYNTTDRFYFGALNVHKHAACACGISGAVCSHTTAAADVKWNEWTSTSSLPTEEGNYYLSANVVLTSQQMLNKNIAICLNGFSITEGTRTEAVGGRNAIIRVGDAGTVTIMNCCAVISDGKLAENSAGIKGFTADGTSGGAFHINSGRTLNLYGVQVSGNTNTNTNVNGWTAGAILMVANDNDAMKLNIGYCRFEDNKATNANGGAIIIRGGTADVRNTVFDGNEAKTKGGAIYMINKASNVTITNCDFTGNKVTSSSSEGGAALYAGIGTATLTNVTMTGNENAGNHGTAITYGGTSVLVLDDCVITGNNNTSTSNAKKGGIALVNSNARMTVKGATIVDNNMNGLGGTNPVECNLYLRTDGSKLIVDALEEGTSIRITTGDHAVSDDPDVFMAYTDKTPVIDATEQPWLVYENREKAGSKVCIIGYKNDSERFYFDSDVSHTHAACACAISGATCGEHSGSTVGTNTKWNEWTSKTSLPTTAGHYYLTDNVVLSNQQLINADVRICLNGFSITEGTRTETAGSRNAIIRVGDAGKLTMVNCQAVITNGRLAEDSVGIKGFTADGTSGGVFHVNSGRTLNLYGVQISGNTNTNTNDKGWTAGAILAVANDNDALKLNIGYCRFEDNKAPNATGGAIIVRGGAANIYNTVFDGNEAKIKGGAIYMMNKSSNVTVTDCDFTGNKTASGSEGGAAMYINTGSALLTNVTMTGNENAGNHGTAITYGGNSVLTLDDCTIMNNTNTSTSNAKKGAIACVNDNATLLVKGATKVDGNVNGTNSSATVICNIYLRTSKSKMTVGALESGALLRVTTGDHVVEDDPDVFLTYTQDTPVMEAKSQPWIIYENREQAGNGYCIVAYSNDEERFYFDVASNHRHTACICSVEGIDCDSHENPADAAVYGWSEWTSTTSLPTSAGYYYLTGDVVLTSQQYMSKDVNICLNGYSITQGERTENEGSRNAIIRVGNGGSLTIVNCKAVVKDGKLDKTSAGIKGFTADGTSAGAIHVNAEAKLKVVGVVFSDNTNTNTNPNGWTAGAILVVYEKDKVDPELNIAYSLFDGNKATGASGGAVIIRGGSAQITNTVFSNNESAGKNAVGGAIWLTNIDPKLTMTDCEFIGNKLTDAESQGGAAFYITKGSAVLTNVTMTGNTNTGHHGTAITVGGDAVLTLDSCSITDNDNTNAYSAKKGGVAVVSDNAKLIVRGKTVIDNNMNGTSGTAELECNIYLRTANAKLTVEQLQKGADIKVTTGDHNVDKFSIVQPVEDPDQFLVKGVEGNWDPTWNGSWITYENNGRNVAFSYDEEILFYFDEPKGHVHCFCGDGEGVKCNHDAFGWVAWDRTDSLPTSSGTYYLTADVVVIKSQNYAGTSEVNICLNGHTITPAKDMKSVILNVYDDAHLTVSDCTATGSGTGYKSGKITGAMDGAVRIGKTDLGTDAVLNWYDGTITKNQREYYGGGLRMVGKCTFNMYGGLFSNNKCYKAHGGGIGADGGDGVVNIYAGTFSGNTANQSGGAIMGKKATINIYGGLFTNNYASDNGGAIYNEAGSVTVTGGTFSYNKAPNQKNAKGNYVGQGGAIFVRGDAKNQYGIKLRVSGGSFYGNEAFKGGAILTLTYVQVNITGGKYYQNKANNNGGGIFIGNDCRGSISGCTITENKAVSGGGALTYLAKVDISNCTISNNEATDHGAGMLIQRESEITMKNVTFSGNEAAKYGAALRMDNKSQVEMNECKVVNNTSGETGNIFASGDVTKLTLNDCSIQNNTAKQSGGGISAMSYARIVMNGGIISGNSAKELGGGAYIRKGYMELHGGEISGNMAGVGGGGLEIEGIDIIMHRDVLLMTDGKIIGNTAPLGAGARFLSGKNTITGGTFEGNSGEYGGGINVGSTGWVVAENVEVKNNSASVNGGGVYLDRGSRTTWTNAVITGNNSKQDGAGIWADDDVNMYDLTVTGNTADNGVGGIFLAKADYDGYSYVSSVIKIGGKMQVKDNKGTAPGMYISEGTLVNVAGMGLADGTYINADLQSGLLTRTVIGSYDYEGGDLKYVITAGDRSLTDPEKVPVENSEPVTEPVEQDAEETEFPWMTLVIAGAALILILILILILLMRRKKKNGGKNS